MPEIEKKALPFEAEIKAEDGSAGEFSGLGSAFGNVDLGKDKIMPKAFDDTLTDWQKKGQLPMMPWFHDMWSPVGEWEEMKTTNKGLQASGFLWVEGNKAGRHPLEESARVYNLLKSNGPKALSIGYRPVKVSFEKVKGEQVRLLEKVDLLELSIVPFGMNPKALINNVKSIEGEAKQLTERQLENYLRDAGFSRGEAKAFLAKGFSGLVDLRDAGEEPKGDFSAVLESIKKLNSLMKGE